MRDTMLLYTAYLDKFKKLTDEQFGQLVRTLLEYQATGEAKEPEDPMVAMAFDVIRSDLDLNNEKFKEKCEKRKEAGQKGAQKRWEKPSDDSKGKKEIAKIANAINAKNEIAKMPEYEYESEYEYEIEAEASNAREETSEVIETYEIATKNCDNFLKVDDMTTKAKKKLQDEINASLMVYSDAEINQAIQNAAQSEFLRYKVKWRPGLSWILDNVDDLVAGKYTDPPSKLSNKNRVDKLDQLTQIEQLALKGGTG